jgi:hypothetical protein
LIGQYLTVLKAQPQFIDCFIPFIGVITRINGITGIAFSNYIIFYCKL